MKDDEDNPIGMANTNPLLDSIDYEVKFDDGTTKILTANIIAENLLAQVDEEGGCQQMLEEIVDHHILPDAIPKSKALLRQDMEFSIRYAPPRVGRFWGNGKMVQPIGSH
jgi:hypothetical protein